MKKITFLLILLSIGGISFGQKNEKATIFLNDGSQLKGRFVRVDDNKIAVRSGKNVFVLKDSQIDSISSKSNFNNDSHFAPYFFKTSFGVLAGSSNNEKKSPFSFDASFNYRMLPKFYSGLGVGVDLLENSYMPVFLNLEYHFRNTRFSPFVGAKGGYMVPLDKKINTNIYYDIAPWVSYWPSGYQSSLDNQGGLMFNPSFGFVNQVNENLGISLSFGYRYHEITFKGEDHYQLEKSYNRLTISLGILFN